MLMLAMRSTGTANIGPNGGAVFCAAGTSGLRVSGTSRRKSSAVRTSAAFTPAAASFSR